MKRSLEIDLNKCTTDEEREKCLSIAKCLEGSPIDRAMALLVSVSSVRGMFVTEHKSCWGVNLNDKITISIDRMKVNLHLAIEQRLSVRCFYTDPTGEDEGWRTWHLFDKNSAMDVFGDLIDGRITSTSLDLAPIEADEIKGCRIVERGE